MYLCVVPEVLGSYVCNDMIAYCSLADPGGRGVAGATAYLNAVLHEALQGQFAESADLEQR